MMGEVGALDERALARRAARCRASADFLALQSGACVLSGLVVATYGVGSRTLSEGGLVASVMLMTAWLTLAAVRRRRLAMGGIATQFDSGRIIVRQPKPVAPGELLLPTGPFEPRHYSGSFAAPMARTGSGALGGISALVGAAAGCAGARLITGGWIWAGGAAGVMGLLSVYSGTLIMLLLEALVFPVRISVSPGALTFERYSPFQEEPLWAQRFDVRSVLVYVDTCLWSVCLIGDRQEAAFSIWAVPRRRELAEVLVWAGLTNHRPAGATS